MFSTMDLTKAPFPTGISRKHPIISCGILNERKN